MVMAKHASLTGVVGDIEMMVCRRLERLWLLYWCWWCRLMIVIAATILVAQIIFISVALSFSIATSNVQSTYTLHYV
jgi:hypothetical protein